MDLMYGLALINLFSIGRDICNFPLSIYLFKLIYLFIYVGANNLFRCRGLTLENKLAHPDKSCFDYFFCFNVLVLWISFTFYYFFVIDFV